MSAGTQYIVDLSPARLLVCVVRDQRVVAQHHAPLRLDPDAPMAQVALTALPGLRAAAAAILPARARVDLVYTSSTAQTSVASCPLTSKRHEAQHAAMLSLGEQCTFPIFDNPSVCVTLHDDRPAPAGAAHAQRHTLAAADADEACEALVELVTGAGLRIGRVLPREALGLSAAVRGAVDTGQSGTIVHLWIGEESSVLAASVDGRLRAVRPISVGLASLVDALSRSGSRLSLNAPAARALLLTQGVPTFDEPLEAMPGLTGAAVLPLLMPVIQRLGVEIKQTLRFGLSEPERAGASLIVGGAGVLVARLPESIGALAGTPARAAPSAGVLVSIADPLAAEASHGAPSSGVTPTRPNAADASSAAESAASRQMIVTPWGELRRLRATLRTSTQDALARAARLRRMVHVGVAASLAMVAGLALMADADLRRERDGLSRLGDQAQRAAVDVQTQEAARLSTRAWATARQALRDEIGPSMDVGAALREIGASLPASFKLSRLEVQSSAGGPGSGGISAQLVGWTPVQATRDFPGEVRALAEQLQRSPLVTGVKLGATSRASERGQEANRFELNVSLVGLSPDWLFAPALAPLAGVETDRANAGTGATR